MATGTVQTLNTSNVSVKSSGNLVDSTGKTNTAVTESTKSTQTTKPADSAQVSKNLNASVDAYVKEQPVQKSGFMGSNNNGGDIAKATENARAQAAEVAALIKDSGLSTSDALKVVKQFDSNLKAAAGKPLSTGQMLDLQVMIDNAVTAAQTASTKTPATPATPTVPTTPAVVDPKNSPTVMIAIRFGRDDNYDSSSQRKDSKQTSNPTVVIDMPSNSSQGSTPIIELAFTTSDSKKDSSKTTSNPVVQRVDVNTPKLEDKTAA